jgi:Arc/MetJ-type ribon-helix-helix transcriptional regulator
MTKKIHVSLSLALTDQIERLREETHSLSIADVLRTALILYASAFEAHKEGKELIVRDKKDRSESRIAIFFPAK